MPNFLEFKKATPLVKNIEATLPSEDSQGLLVRNITKRFGDVPALKDVDLAVRTGEFFTLLGPSGCGKTTTLRMVAGFEKPTRGRILFGRQDVTGLMVNQRNMGFVFQNYALFPHMTVFDNVAFGLQMRRLDRATIQ